MSLSRREVLRTVILGGAAAGCIRAPSGDAASDTDLPLADVVLDKKPWVTVLGPTQIRLRFETLVDVAAPVWLSGPDDVAHELTPTRTEANLTYENQTLSDTIPADTPGLHVLHELIVDDLVPGAVYAWRVPTQTETHEGAFRCPPDPTTAVRIGWLADTMWPNTDATVAALAAQSPDIVVHGGDLQYSDNPSDTWAGLFHSLVPLTSSAPLQVTIGNHEIEKDGELLQMYDRLFAMQTVIGLERTHSFRAGSALFIVLDSESSDLSDSENVQFPWLDAQLAAASTDDTVKIVILAWHRPLYTFSDHYHSDTADEDAMLPHIVGTKVRLVLGGHSHSFEHFHFKDIDWIVDGSAGALLYNVNDNLATATEQRPELVAARLFSEQAYGCCTIDVAPDGSTVVRRLIASDGSETYRVMIAATA